MSGKDYNLRIKYVWRLTRQRCSLDYKHVTNYCQNVSQQSTEEDAENDSRQKVKDSKTYHDRTEMFSEHEHEHINLHCWREN